MSDTHTLTPAVIHQAPLPERMHPVVAAAMAHNPDPATLRELLAVQREWEAGEAKKEYARAMVALKKDLPAVIARDKTVAFGNTRYTHVSLAAIMDAVTPHLANYGFKLGWKPSTQDKTVTVTCELAHAGGHVESCTISGPIDTQGAKSPIQGTMSTITMLQRYTAQSLLGIASADMPEPTGGTAPDKVDTKRTMAAKAHLSKLGVRLPEAEAMLGKASAEWTNADLDSLKAWLGEREPAHDPKTGEVVP